MKRLLLCLSIAACGHSSSAPAPTGSGAPSHPAPPPIPTPTPVDAAIPPTPEARAQTVVDGLAKQDFDGVEKTFSAEVAKALPKDTLSTMWTQLQSQAGALGTCEEPKRRPAKPGEPIVVTIPCHFTKGALDFVIAVDDKLAVVGLHLAPHQSDVPWSPPPYAAADSTARELPVGDLPGTLALPGGKGPFPCVVLVHGSGPNDRDETVGANKPFADLAAGLAAHGIATLRYEKRTRAKPTSLPKDLTVNDETIKDAVIAADLCASQPEIDAKRVFVLGHSLGAWVAPRIAKGTTKLAGIIVLAAPSRDLADIIVEQTIYIANTDGTVSPDEQKSIDEAKANAKRIHEIEGGAAAKPDEMIVGAPASYWKDLASYDAPALAATLKLPIFVGQGGRDYQVSATKDFPAWQKALGKKKGDKLVMWPKLSHLLIAGEGPSTPADYAKPGHVDEQVIKDVADWIQTKR
jgi:dienelactone hydrolase